MDKFFLLVSVGVLCCTSVGARMAYRFASGYEDIIGEPAETFSCDGRQYGYYADVDNDCRIFHICLPIPDFDGNIVQTYQYSFFCGNQTIFNQETLTCDHPEYAFPCEEAANLYDLKNSEFGRIDSSDERF